MRKEAAGRFGRGMKEMLQTVTKKGIDSRVTAKSISINALEPERDR